MGTKGQQIVGLKIDDVIEMLNKAFADEWLAYYQYWLGAKVVKGPMKDAAIAAHVHPSPAEADLTRLR